MVCGRAMGWPATVTRFSVREGARNAPPDRCTDAQGIGPTPIRPFPTQTAPCRSLAPNLGQAGACDALSPRRPQAGDMEEPRRPRGAGALPVGDPEWLYYELAVSTEQEVVNGLLTPPMVPAKVAVNQT